MASERPVFDVNHAPEHIINIKCLKDITEKCNSRCITWIQTLQSCMKINITLVLGP